jgi:hypothetical protein
MQSILVAFSSEYSTDHTLSISYTCKQLFRTAEFFEAWQTIGTNGSMFVDIGYSAH